MIFKRLMISAARRSFSSDVSYVQGQSPAPKLREYFYYIDHEGMLFLDDARIKNFTSCFKEKKFLEFFFKRLRLNDGDRYREHFPFVSPCGRERNYIRCDDVPVVFTHVYRDADSVHLSGKFPCLQGADRGQVRRSQGYGCIRFRFRSHQQKRGLPEEVSPRKEGSERLAFAHAGDLLNVPWEPNRICMFPLSGRVYHPAPERYGSVGLIRSKLAIELSRHFTFLHGEEQPPTHFTWNSMKHELDRDWWKSTYINRRGEPLE